MFQVDDKVHLTLLVSKQPIGRRAMEGIGALLGETVVVSVEAADSIQSMQECTLSQFLTCYMAPLSTKLQSILKTGRLESAMGDGIPVDPER